jgi:hypothetical protein
MNHGSKGSKGSKGRVSFGESRVTKVLKAG